MEPIDIKALEEAVVLFYRSTSNQQAVAHDWLTKAQSSTQAWSFSWDLMQLGKSQEVQFFGAITLHSKLMKFWHEVPPENRDELKQKLLEHIIMFAGGPKIVLNRLCIALSAFIVHMLKDWPTAIEDVLNTFQSQQIPNVTPETQLWIMLEVLSGIPEEANAIYTSVRRVTLRGEINKKAPIVMKVIEGYLEAQVEREWRDEDITNVIKAVKCADIWIKNGGYQIDKCHKLTDCLLKSVNKVYWPNAHDDGCLSADENDLAEASLKTLANIMKQPESHLYPNNAFTLIKMCLDSLTDITKSEWRENNPNEDIAVNIYTLFISSIERHSRLLMAGVCAEESQHGELYSRLVNEILQCTNKPGIYPVEESCSNLAMAFWYLLQDEVFSLANNEEKNKCLKIIQPLYAHLTRILIRKAQQPDEASLDKWNADDLETFRCYRQDIADTLLYCYDVLKNHIFVIFSSALNEAIVEVQSDPSSWTKLEACILAFLAVAERTFSMETEQIPKMMEVLNNIPYEKLNEKLLGTALETVGAYCLWFKDNPEYIPSAIQLLVKGLNSSMASQATLGLKELCRDCQIQLKPYAEPLLEACQAVLLGGRLKNSESVRLMFSIGRLMSMLPPAKITSCLDAMVSPCFEELQMIAQAGAKTEPAKIRTLYRLNMISTLFSSLNTNTEDGSVLNESYSNGGVQPILIVMQNTMPIFKQITELWIQETQVVEASCNALKHAITNLMTDFKPMLQDLCVLIISIMQNICSAPLLAVSKTCILMFYKDEDCKGLMQQFLVEVISHTFRLFEQTLETNFSNISDVVEMFYNVNFHIVKKVPEAISNGTVDLNRLISYALRAITLPETGAIRYGIQFISHFITQSRQYPIMMQTVLDKGEDIIRTAILCIGCHTPRPHVDKFADIFLAANKKYPAELVVWMKMLGTYNFPTPVIENDDKMKFMSQIVRERVNKRLIQNYISEFATKSRGLSEKL
ncbi:unnamed protein product [Hermetia illucens]|uniref:Importin-13 n=1 Tax=Hermetia illucens TaxID=343691 RepID=A0A7R8V4N4_HERIL|nr:importin-13 [Hermetia illucens]CAD7092399.1 unnamed protein product [Hermetia illucens]